jgi:aryl-alcohol dehydrogenase-like predicted oxidoreductase
MKYGYIKGLDKKVSRIVQGTLGVDEKVMDTVFELGCNAIDTATVYGNEGMLGKWMACCGIREEIVIFTKGAESHDEAGTPRVNSECIAEDLMKSLELLQTDYIDLYGLHRDDINIGVDEIVDCLNEHKNAGRIHVFGASNWSVERLQAANKYAADNGKTGFAFSSPNFCLAEQYEDYWVGTVSISGPQHENERQWYRKENMPLLTWSSLGNGFLTGKFSRDMYENTPDDIPEDVRLSFCGDGNFTRLERAEQLAKEKNLSLVQIALAFVFNSGLNLFAVTASHNADELKENVAAMAIELTQAQVDWLDLKSDER